MALTGDALPDWLLARDIVASIEAASRLGDRKWRALLDAHYAILRAELDRFGGREIDTAGDGLFAAFTGPARDQLRLRDARCGPHPGHRNPGRPAHRRGRDHR